ncbi:MAG TPA: hypothetical protein VMT24_17025 [Aggregatilineaceae bacterium]|nr:hypothetical protein [Aggregatilineaceae bacterium]
MRNLTQNRFFLFFFIVVLALVGVLSTLLATSRGIGIEVDSVKYLEAAHNLATGHGLTAQNVDGTFTPLTWYPPLYPTLLTLGQTAGIPVQDGARWLNVILSGLATLLMGFVLIQHFPNSFWLPVLGTLLLLISDKYIESILAVALTEALFIFLSFSGLVLFASFLKTQRRDSLVASSVFIGLACLTRYVGLTLVISAAILILLRYGKITQTVISSLWILVLLGFGPLAAWLFYGHIVGLDARSFSFHPVSTDKIESGLVTNGASGLQ